MKKAGIIVRYRPQKLADVAGQDKRVGELKTMIVTGDLYQNNYLLSGKYGTGKTTIARIMAKVILCEGREDHEIDPCEKCPACAEVDAGGIMRGFQEIDAGASGGIDEIRSVIELAQKHPGNASGWKVFIIDEAHLLTKQAASAMLKVLEAKFKVVFILATTDPQKLIPTVKSRLKHIVLEDPTADDISKMLFCQVASKELKFGEGDETNVKEVLGMIAAKTAPHVRDALTLFDDFRVRFCKNGEYNWQSLKIVKEFLADGKQTWFNILKMIADGNIDPSLYESELDGISKDSDRTLDQLFIGFMKIVAAKASGKMAGVEGMSMREYRGVFWIMYEALKSQANFKVFFKEVIMFALVECGQAKKDDFLGGLMHFAGEMLDQQQKSAVLLDAMATIAGKGQEIAKKLAQTKDKAPKSNTEFDQDLYKD